MPIPVATFPDGQVSSLPSSPTPGMRKSMAGPHAKRHASEFSRSITKRRRLVSLAAPEEAGAYRSNPASDDDDDGRDHDDGNGTNDQDELSIMPHLDDPIQPPPSDLSSAPRRPNGSFGAKHHRRTSSQPQHTPLNADSRPGSQALVGQKVRAFGAYLLANPPRPTLSTATDTEDAAAQVAALQEEYKALETKLQLARARLSDQLTNYDAAGGGSISVGTTPASLRPSSSMPVAVHVDEDDAVASALAHIANLEARRANLLAGLHVAQATELDARQQRDGRQLTVQVENARLFRRLVDLGPTGAASVLRVLLGAAGVHPADAFDGVDAGLEVAERKARIRHDLDDDILREGLLPPSSDASPSRFSAQIEGTTTLIDLADTNHNSNGNHAGHG